MLLVGVLPMGSVGLGMRAPSASVDAEATATPLASPAPTRRGVPPLCRRTSPRRAFSGRLSLPSARRRIEAIDSQDTMAFSALTGVRSMNELLPLERAGEAYDRMMSGKARFRVVLTTGG